jgi:hypothetical protein
MKSYFSMYSLAISYKIGRAIAQNLRKKCVIWDHRCSKVTEKTKRKRKKCAKEKGARKGCLETGPEVVTCREWPLPWGCQPRKWPLSEGLRAPRRRTRRRRSWRPAGRPRAWGWRCRRPHSGSRLYGIISRNLRTKHIRAIYIHVDVYKYLVKVFSASLWHPISEFC